MPPSLDRGPARDLFRGVIALAPMATGGNLPYRRLCREYGADLTCSEMIVADKLVRRSRSELPLLRRHESESVFGVQLCGKSEAGLVEAARMAADTGCSFLDLNFGCPIDLIVRHGAGAALMKRPAKLVRLVAAVRQAVDLPLSVKIRSGWSAETINAVPVARQIEAAGADALVVHGRTREARYRRAADWQLVAEVAAAVEIPVIGNGDILTHWDVDERTAGTRIASVMVARGALIKPWIFRELKERRAIRFGPAERWAMMRRWWELATEHFGADELGQRRVERFFLWHLGFWRRYRFYGEAEFRASPHPLIQKRDDEPEDPEERLLASEDPEDQRRIWERVRAGDLG